MTALPYKLAGKIAAGIAILLLVLGSFEIISPSEKAVKVTLGTVTSQVYGPGVQFKLPMISHFDTYDLKPNTDDLVVDIGLRILSPRELARCQGFPDTYVLTGTKSNQVAKIGNSVPPQMVEALVRANLSGALAPQRRRRAA